MCLTAGCGRKRVGEGRGMSHACVCMRVRKVSEVSIFLDIPLDPCLFCLQCSTVVIPYPGSNLPPACMACLPGVVQVIQIVRDEGLPLKECNITPAQLHFADEVRQSSCALARRLMAWLLLALTTCVRMLRVSSFEACLCFVCV